MMSNKSDVYLQVHTSSNAENKDGVEVGEQVSLRWENGEEETGKSEAGQIGDNN